LTVVLKHQIMKAAVSHGREETHVMCIKNIMIPKKNCTVSDSYLVPIWHWRLTQLWRIILTVALKSKLPKL